MPCPSHCSSPSQGSHSVSSVRCELQSVCQQPSNTFPSTLKKEATCASETLVNNEHTRRHIPEDAILHSHRRENLKVHKAVIQLHAMETYGEVNRIPDPSIKWRFVSFAAARVRAQVGSCGICGGQSGAVAGFLQYFCSPCQFSFHRVLHTHHRPSSGTGGVADVPRWLISPRPKKLKENVEVLSVSRSGDLYP
jgi:hypothetical protein